MPPSTSRSPAFRHGWLMMCANASHVSLRPPSCSLLYMSPHRTHGSPALYLLQMVYTVRDVILQPAIQRFACCSRDKVWWLKAKAGNRSVAVLQDGEISNLCGRLWNAHATVLHLVDWSMCEECHSRRRHPKDRSDRSQGSACLDGCLWVMGKGSPRDRTKYKWGF